MATLLKHLQRLITGIKQFITKIEERAFLTNGNQPTPGTSPHPGSRNGAGRNGHTHGTAATVPQGTTTLTQASQAERDAYWATSSHTTRDAQMQEWERQTDAWLAGLQADPALWEQYAFLQRLLGGDKNGQAHAPVEVSARALYRTFFEEANGGGGDFEYFVKRIVETNTTSQLEDKQNRELIEYFAGFYGSETGKRALPRIDALIHTRDRSNGHSARQTPAFVLGIDLATGQEVSISDEARSQMMTVIGGTGSGKTTLMLNGILSDARAGKGFAVFDPHGPLTRAVIAGLPENRLEDVSILDVTDSEHLVGVNPFACPEPRTVLTMSATSSFLSHIFNKIWGAGYDTPRLMQVLRAVTRVLIDNPGTTFAEIPLLFSNNDSVRASLVANVMNPSIVSFWEGYNRRSQREKDELIASTLNKVMNFLDNDLIRAIVAQSNTTLDVRKIMAEGKILLVRLSPQFSEASGLIGATLIAQLLMASYSRAGTLEHERTGFALWCDEYQRYATSDFATLCTEARKADLQLCLAFQVLDMIEDFNIAAALQAGTLVTLRVSGNDSKVLARSYSAALSQQQELIGQEPVRAVVTDPISHLLHHSHPDARVAKWAQTALQNHEQFIKKPTGKYEHQHQWAAYHDSFNGTVYLTQRQVLQGRELITQSLYQSMVERRPAPQIAPLAVYTLALAQGDGREYIFSPWVKKSIDTLKEFREGAERFGTPAFITPKSAATFIHSASKQYKWMAEAVINQMTEWHYVLSVLSENPLLCDTGNFVPKYRQRLFTDLEAERANMMATQPNYQAFVKILTAEHVIRTLPPLLLLPEAQVNERIREIKQRMRLQGITKSYSEVEAEIRERQERLRARVNDAPPPSHTTNGRLPRRLRQKPPPAFT